MDLRIQRSVVSTLSNRPQVLEIGPFVAGLDPESISPFINYATPQPGAAITAADVTALVRAFEQADRKPRLEYVTSSSPELEDLLLAAGFTVEARHEYLICTPGKLVAPPVPNSLDLEEPTTDRDRAALAAAVGESFGEPPQAPEASAPEANASQASASQASASQADASRADVARMRRTQDLGGVALAALVEGECVGGGQAMPPHQGVSEIGGIGVRQPFRGRGFGGSITAGLTERLFRRGVEIAWLEAGGEDSWRVYERVGYRPAGRRLYISR